MNSSREEVARLAAAATVPVSVRRLDPDEVAQRVVDVFMTIRTEVKKIMAPLGRSQSLPIGMSDALGIDDKAIAERLQINYIC